MTTDFWAPITRDVVVVSGPDATSYLQSLVSQDLEPVSVGASAHALLLQPQGKLLVDMYMLRVEPDAWWCICEGGFGSTLAEGLRRFKIRVKAEVEERAVRSVAVRGMRPEPGALAIVAVDWDGRPAFDVVGGDAEVNAFAATLELPELDEAGYERARIEAGVPRQGLDIDERTIPQEAFLDRTAVSFTKGCFLGQELVCRIDTRGHVNRLLRRLRAGAPVLARGESVMAGDKTVGEVTSSVGDVALAMVRHEIEPGATVAVGDASATVEAVAPFELA
jgi:folate-binding protein YgfZ